MAEEALGPEEEAVEAQTVVVDWPRAPRSAASEASLETEAVLI